MRKLISVLLALCLCLSFAGCGQKTDSAKDQLESIKEKGEIVIAMEGCWAPWTYHDENDKLATKAGQDKKEATDVKTKNGVIIGYRDSSIVFINIQNASKKISNNLLVPATNAALNISKYIDEMMGSGYALLAGVTETEIIPAEISFWSPVLWLLLFVIILVAVFIVVLTGLNTRGKVLEASAEEPENQKYATFFGGEKSEHSHVSGSDLFWGFKKNFKGYFKFMDKAHDGNLNN